MTSEVLTTHDDELVWYIVDAQEGKYHDYLLRFSISILTGIILSILQYDQPSTVRLHLPPVYSTTLPSDMFGSNKNKFDPNKEIPDLSGKVYVVTGGSAGLGKSH